MITLMPEKSTFRSVRYRGSDWSDTYRADSPLTYDEWLDAFEASGKDIKNAAWPYSYRVEMHDEDDQGRSMVTTVRTHEDYLD